MPKCAPKETPKCTHKRFVFKEVSRSFSRQFLWPTFLVCRSRPWIPTSKRSFLRIQQLQNKNFADLKRRYVKQRTIASYFSMSGIRRRSMFYPKSGFILQLKNCQRSLPSMPIYASCLFRYKPHDDYEKHSCLNSRSDETEETVLKKFSMTSFHLRVSG